MRPALRAFLIALLCLPFCTAATAQTRCSGAHSPREKAVCRNKDLASLDRDLAGAYNSARNRLSPAGGPLLQADERAWLVWTDKVCPANNPATNLVDCLRESYRTRIAQLTEMQQLNGKHLLNRARFVYTAGKPPAGGSDQARFDPGFGSGAFSWPQIDMPDADGVLFNKALADAVVPAETALSDRQAPTFEAATNTTEQLTGYAHLFAANDRFVDIDFFSEVYFWGGAHGGMKRTSFLWNNTLRKRLEVADLLRPDSDWQRRLLEPAIAKLRKAHTDGTLWEGKELNDGVSSAIANPGQWDASREGLTLTFAQYEVTCYACGTPEITFTWEELASYLRPGFDHAALPARQHVSD